MSLKSPSKFFYKKTFIPKRLADELMRRHHFKSTGGKRGTVWRYEGSIYRPDGEQVILKDAQELLGERARDNYIRETLHHIERATHTDLVDPDTDYINVQNGRLNWRALKLEEHTPKVFEITQLPVHYNPDVKCPEFDHYLNTTLDAELHPLIEELIGYCLLRDARFQKAFILFGEGSNGKSVLMSTLLALLGKDNVSSVALQDLEEHRFRLAELYGKLANLCADIDDRALRSSSIFKAVVTGDSITAERKYKDPFDFQPYATPVYSCNKLPKSRDNTDGFHRRWIIIPFERTFTGKDDDRGLSERLIRPDELSGILNRGLCGLCRLFDNNGFTEPQKVQAALDAYKTQNDSVKAFMAECVEIDSDGSVTKTNFKGSYYKWCRLHRLQPADEKHIKGSIAAVAPHVKECRPGGQARSWKGIRLNGEAPHDMFY